jgi:hypothetical protein
MNRRRHTQDEWHKPCSKGIVQVNAQDECRQSMFKRIAQITALGELTKWIFEHNGTNQC